MNSELKYSNKAKGWWIKRKTFKISNVACSYVTRDISCHIHWKSGSILQLLKCIPTVNTVPHRGQLESLWECSCGRLSLSSMGNPLCCHFREGKSWTPEIPTLNDWNLSETGSFSWTVISGIVKVEPRKSLLWMIEICGKQEVSLDCWHVCCVYIIALVLSNDITFVHCLHIWCICRGPLKLIGH